MNNAARSLLVLGFLVVAACGGGGDGSAGPDAGRLDDAALPSPDGTQPDAPPVTGSCDASHLGTGDGCDCGCGVTDSDCPTPLTAGACEYSSCPTGTAVDPQNPTQCVQVVVPATWTCGAPAYSDGLCNCGCGAVDPDCGPGATLATCGTSNGCNAGMWPDPANPSQCVTKPAGWTCSEQSYTDTMCSCGCGIADPACTANPHISECKQDGCPSGQSPDPTHVTQCMTNAPEDHWTCPLTALADGQTCDCGCGAIDPDCGANATAAACEATHCPAGDELKTGDISKCWEVCHATAPSGSGTATCTNGGNISFGGLACERDASACSDGHRYAIECESGECSCKIDGQCVGHAQSTTCGFSACGWGVIGPS